MTDAPQPVNSIVNRAPLRQAGRMKTALRMSALAFCLSACAPLSIYYREGESVSRMQTETTQCQVKALKDAPVATQIRQSPPIYYPPRTYCHGPGQCYTRPGWWEPGRVYSVDANAGLRKRVEAQCMAQKGFRPVSLPPCRQNVKSQVTAQRTTRLPALAGNSCFAKFDDGSFQIITPTQAG